MNNSREAQKFFAESEAKMRVLRTGGRKAEKANSRREEWWSQRQTLQVNRLLDSATSRDLLPEEAAYLQRRLGNGEYIRVIKSRRP